MGEQGLITYIQKSICNHPFISSTVALFYIFYKFFPCTFFWVVSVLPVFICTALLLGTLVCYCDPNISEIEADEKNGHEISSRELRNNEITRALSKQPIPKPLSSSKTFVIKRGYSVRRLGRSSSMVDGNCSNVTVVDVCKEINGVNANPSKGKPKHSISSDSETESKQSENSNQEASMDDVMPALGELHPLLDPEPEELAHKSVSNSYAPSHASSQSHESDESGGEETENQEEEEETQGEKDDGSDGVVKWTADDQKNLMDLGTSELERNQRLENLIAKRRMRKIQRAETDKNLIDFDSNDPAPIVEELSRLLVNAPQISIGRRNPFDLPDEPDIPGSAPAMPLSRRNPFDLSFDNALSNVNSDLEGEGSRPPEPIQQRDFVFRRHESFTVGPSFVGDSSATMYPSRFKPFFLIEKTQQEEAIFGPFERQSSEKSDSKMSSAAASESSFVAGDHGASKEHCEHSEGGFGSPAYYNPQHVEAEDVGVECHSSDEDASGDEQEQSDHNMAGDYIMDLNISDIIEENHHIDDESEGKEEDEGVVEVDSKSEVIDVNYDDQVSSSSSETYDGNVDIQAGGQVVANVEQVENVYSKGSIDSIQSVLAESDIHAMAIEKVAEPVYDSSPSATKKTLSSTSAINEALFPGGKESFNSDTFLTSDMQMEMSEADTPRTRDESFLSGDEGSISSNGSVRKGMTYGSRGAWVASPNLSSVDESESRSREVTEIRELDVIQVGFSSFPEDFSTPTAHLMPPSPAVLFGHHPSFASNRTESSEYSSMDEDVSIPSEGDGDQTTTDRNVISDCSVNSMTEMQRSVEESPGQPSSYNSFSKSVWIQDL